MISVIVPVFNGASDGGFFLRECIESILCQTGPEFELIVVDDGSTDNTPEILAGYSAKSDIITIIRQCNGGVSAARNTGVKSAKGDFICFVDADDYLPAGALKILYDAAAKSKSPIVIGQTCRRPNRVYTGRSIRIFTGEEFAARTLYQRGGHNSPWAMLVKRTLLIQEPFDETMRYEDLELSCRLYLRAGRVAVIDSEVYFYRVNPGSFINSWSGSRTDALKATSAIEDFVSKKCRSLLPAARDRRLSANFNVFLLASAHGADRQITDSCWNLICRYRRESLINPRVRLKNKIGILLSYFGRRALLLAGRLVMK
ncbi:MAG: glycosyltransferase family 2 protein [Muribaculaceae bacterium]|nr:glycosyltransferase family 2 protein [Muribaculaceae bacterium]